MKIMVTGSEGYVGSSLVTRLANDGIKVVPYDIKLHQKMDILNVEFLKRYMSGCDVVFNCAAIAGKAECKADPEYSYNVNVIGVKNVMDVATEYNCKPVLISSFAIFGNTVYGKQKRLVEQYKDKAVILRPSNIFGGDNFFIKKPDNFIVHLAQDDPIKVWLGNQTRDFIHINKVLEWCIKAIDLPYGIYDVCTGFQTPKETVALIASTIRNVKIVYQQKNSEEL